MMKSETPRHNHGHHHAHSPTQPARPPAATQAHPPAAVGNHTEHAGHDKHAGHSVEMFRDRFWITLLLSIPTIVWSDMIQMWFDYRAPIFPGSTLLPVRRFGWPRSSARAEHPAA